MTHSEALDQLEQTQRSLAALAGQVRQMAAENYAPDPGTLRVLAVALESHETGIGQASATLGALHASLTCAEEEDD